jgi:glycosyltransferase involved in cell wall biosynthesis
MSVNREARQTEDRSTPEVTVVMPTYNHGLYIGNAISSVLAQTMENFELIVVDNNSIDNTKEIIQQFNDCRIRLKHINNEGLIARSRNLAIKESKAPYIAFLDSDDYWFPEKLERCIKQIKLGADLVYHRMYKQKTIQQDRFKREVRTRALSPNVFDDLVMNGNCIINSSVVLKRKLFEEYGLLREDPDYVGWEDYDMWLRAANNRSFFYIDKVLGVYWAGGGNVTNPRRALNNQLKFEQCYVLPHFRKTSLKHKLKKLKYRLQLFVQRWRK